MKTYEQLELFDLEAYASSKAVPQSDLLFFQSRPKTVYEQLELDLGLDSELFDEDQYSEPAEAA